MIVCVTVRGLTERTVSDARVQQTRSVVTPRSPSKATTFSTRKLGLSMHRNGTKEKSFLFLTFPATTKRTHSRVPLSLTDTGRLDVVSVSHPFEYQQHRNRKSCGTGA